MIVGIDLIHTLLGKSTDALRILQEAEINRKVGWFIINKLNKLGHKVVNCTIDEENDILYDKVYIANKYPLDVFLSINLNIGLKNAIETYIFNNTSKAYKIAASIRRSINERCGLKDDGGKISKSYILEKIKAPAIILDIFLLKEITNEERIYEAIANSIVTALIDEIKEDEKIFKRNYLSVYIQTKVYNTNEIDGIKLDNIIKIFGKYRVYVKSFEGGVFFETQYMNIEEAEKIREKLGDKFLHYCFK